MQISQGLSYLSTVNNVGRLIFCVRNGNRSGPATMAAILISNTGNDHVNYITYQISPGQSETDEAQILVAAD